jgi:hypothetical protein
MWLQRDLSLIGKITILKSLAFSKIIYQCGVITPPPKFIEHIKDLAYTFVWHNKPDKIKHNTLIADYAKSGLKMLDIESFIKAQKTMWVKRFLSTSDASWKAILTLNLEDLLGVDTFNPIHTVWGPLGPRPYSFYYKKIADRNFVITFHEFVAFLSSFHVMYKD